jgi:orotate phosphoribosyltransferase
MLHTGEAINKLGSFYASTIVDNIKDKYTSIFGPAYKGIPLAVAAVNSLFTEYKINVHYSFNRKEAKEYGDMGLIVGKTLTGNDTVIIVDDVITAGTAIRETIETLKEQGNPKISAVIVSVDRMEKGTGEESAIQEISKSSGITFFSIVNILDIIEFLNDTPQREKFGINSEMITKMEEYRSRYGVA